MANEKRLIGCGKGFKHGHFYKPWYRSYKAMMERCYLKSCGNYERYGGKGITVCEEWHDINKFAEWVETSGYTPGLTIDRIDPLGNYEPNNCQWLTRSDNSKKSHTDKKKRAKEMVEVVHAKWSYDGGDAVCSNCGFKWFDGCQECGVCPSDVNYCPNCGAKMDGDGNGTTQD